MLHNITMDADAHVSCESQSPCEFDDSTDMVIWLCMLLPRKHIVLITASADNILIAFMTIFAPWYLSVWMSNYVSYIVSIINYISLFVIIMPKCVVSDSGNTIIQ